MNRGRLLGWGLLLTMGGAPVFAGPFQDPAGPAQAETAAEPLPAAAGAGAPETMVAPDSNGAGPAAEAPAETRWEYPDRLAQLANQPVRPMTEGPLHEAFLSPRKDRNPIHVAKAPPTPISERPAIDPPSANAQWIEGYWEWDPGRKDYVWVTGTWRVPPPGRFWVNGYWKRDQDGWYRVPGFWSDRKTDRLDYHKNGPPKDRPDDDPGEPPAPDCFYIPGQYYPDKDGVVWKKGFWAKAQPGWAWVPAHWVRQPEGWTFQEGYWDRTLEDRGTLFAPAEVDKSTKTTDDLTYQPYTKVSPEMYGQIYGGFGRPNSNYDGYPGVYYDDSGRFYGYANYGNIGGYYGYLDYPYYGGYGYPYYAQPINYGIWWLWRLWWVWRIWRVWRVWPLWRDAEQHLRVRVRLSLLRHVWHGRLRRVRVRRPWLRRVRATAASAMAASGTAASATAGSGTVALASAASGLASASAASVSASASVILLRFRLRLPVRLGLGRMGLGRLGLGTRWLGRLGTRWLVVAGDAVAGDVPIPSEAAGTLGRVA